jgi:hypothetical protein
MVTPSFFILGAAKSGTTSLYHGLLEHPDVYLSHPKEPFFYEAEYDQGMEYYASKYYGGWSGQKAVGDASPRNLFLPFVPERIQKTCPKAKLIISLRNPVDRAYSDWWMNVGFGIEHLSFEDAIRDNMSQLASGTDLAGADGPLIWKEYLQAYFNGPTLKFRTYLDMGYYEAQIRRYYDRFPSEQIKIVYYPDLKSTPNQLLKELFDFLDVDRSYEPANLTPRMVGLGRWGSTLKRMAFELRLIEKTPLSVKTALKRLLTQLGDRRPKMSSTSRSWLSEHYYTHNRRLEALLQRSLPDW